MTRKADPVYRACEGCGSQFRLRKPSAKQRYCNQSCAWLVIGEKVRAAADTPEARAKRGDTRRGTGEGRTYIKRGGRHEHRVVAEQKLGRKLLPGEVVHHKDENKRNNDPDNIEVLPSQAEHARLHFIEIAKRRAAKRLTKTGVPA